MNQEPFFDFVETPDPNEFAFWVRVSTDKFEPKLMPKSGVTTFKDFKLPLEGTSMRSGYGDYIYTQSSQAGTQGFMRFYFAKPKTDEEKNTPFRTWPKVDDFTWDMILLGIGVRPIHGFPQSTYAVVNGVKTLVSATRLRGVEIYIPRTTCPTEFEIEEFISPTPFEIRRHQSPIPMPVNYEVLGLKREFPSCLHDDLELSGTNTGIRMLTGTTGGAITGSIEGYKFPATNFIRWKSHYVHDDQQFTNGVWYRTRIRAIAPKMPNPVSQSGQ